MEEGSNQGGGFGGAEHAAVCSKCGKDTTVPFKPTEGRPVYCRDCFKEMRASNPRPSRGNFKRPNA